MTAAAKEQAKHLLDSVEELPLAELFISISESRKTIAAGPLRDLTLSIEQHGVREPLLVRPLLNGPQMGFEIVSGQRRYLASGLAGKKTAPCLVRELSDDEAAEIRLISNLQREDLPALEEAEAFSQLLDRLLSATAVAAKVGKDIAYVAKRLKLIDLGEHSRKALGAGLITVDHALLLARLGSDEEDAALKWCVNVNAGVKTTVEAVVDERIKIGTEGHTYSAWEPQSVQRLKEHIEQHSGRALERAPWDLDDADLVVAAGACSSCPSNTSSNTALFADLNIEAATCANGACFESKRVAFVHLQGVRQTARDETAPLRVSWKSTAVKPRWAKDGKGPDLAQIFKYGQWLDVKKGSCENIHAAIVVDWSDSGDRGRMGSGRKLRKPGETILVCVTEGCKAHPKGWEKAKLPASGVRNANSDDGKAERAKLAEAAIAESKLRIAFVSAAIESVTAIPAEALRVIALDTFPNWEGDQKPFNAILPGIFKILKTGKVNSAEFAKAVCLASIAADELTVPEWRQADATRKDLIAAVRRLGYKGPTPWDKAPTAKPAKKVVAKKVVKKAAKKAARRGSS